MKRILLMTTIFAFLISFVGCTQPEEKEDPVKIKKEIEEIVAQGMDKKSGILGPFNAVWKLTHPEPQLIGYGQSKPNKYKKYTKKETLAMLLGEYYIRYALSLLPCPNNQRAKECENRMKHIISTRDTDDPITTESEEKLQMLIPKLYASVMLAYLHDAEIAAKDLNEALMAKNIGKAEELKDKNQFTSAIDLSGEIKRIYKILLERRNQLANGYYEEQK
jgi:hypothetical protein